MLSERSKTITDISRELDLAPSTVSQHITELRSMGAIEQVENYHVRKWKYYRVSPGFGIKLRKEDMANQNQANGANPMGVMNVINRGVPQMGRHLLYG